MGTYFVNVTNLESLSKELIELDATIETLEREKLRAQVNKFHETKFKNRLKKFLLSHD
jgi:hypothetical protein